MPVAYHINPDEGLITVRAEGDLALAEIVRLGRDLLDDPAYAPSLPQLADLRGLRPLPASGLDDLREFVQEHYRAQVTASVAVVIDDHLENRHCADIFLLTCAIHDAELFADYDQALKWLMRTAFATAEPLAEQRDTADDYAYCAPE